MGVQGSGLCVGVWRCVLRLRGAAGVRQAYGRGRGCGRGSARVQCAPTQLLHVEAVKQPQLTEGSHHVCVANEVVAVFVEVAERGRVAVVGVRGDAALAAPARLDPGAGRGHGLHVKGRIVSRHALQSRQSRVG